MNEKWQSVKLLRNNKSLVKACEEIFSDMTKMRIFYLYVNVQHKNRFACECHRRQKKRQETHSKTQTEVT